MLSHPLRSGSLFPLSWLPPPLPHCPPPPCLLHSPSSLLVWLPRSVWLCCSSPCPLAILGAPCAHPLLSHPPAPPPPPRTRISRPRTTLTVSCAVGWSRPCCHPRGGHLPVAGRSPRPYRVHGHLVEGGGVWLLMARSASAAFGGCCGARTSWSPCAVLCVLLGLVSPPCVGRPCSQLLGCVRSSQFGALFSSAGALRRGLQASTTAASRQP